MWSPRWRYGSEAKYKLLVTNTADGTEVRIFTASAEPGIWSWFDRWLNEYLATRSESERLVDVTFFYVLVGKDLGRADGTVSADSGVIEFGNGSDPAGPPDGEELTFEALVAAATRILE